MLNARCPSASTAGGWMLTNEPTNKHDGSQYLLSDVITVEKLLIDELMTRLQTVQKLLRIW